MNAKRGVAVLQKRSGNFITAMETYLEMISSIEHQAIIIDLNKVVN